MKDITVFKTQLPAEEPDFRIVLRSRAKELRREQIDSMSRAAARDYYLKYGHEWPQKPAYLCPAVCFTGFTAEEMEELMVLAGAQELRVVNTVSDVLNFLVCGPETQPEILQKAFELGTPVMGSDDFRSMTF